VARLTLDTGVLVAFERGEPAVRRWLDRAFARVEPPTVPTVVVAQAWRGGRHPRIARLLRACEVEPVDEVLARRAGELLGRTGTDDPVDAIVAQSAARRGDTVLTSDPSDMQRLADDLGTIRVRAI
jgi:predicted nucleic acid-binding protein